MYKLRPYQAEAITKVNESFRTVRSTLIVMATGLGKTIVFSHLAKDFLQRGRIMVLAHRGELIYQAHEKLTSIAEYEPEIEMGEQHAMEDSAWRADIICSTIQTQIAGMNGKGRMTKFDPNEFSLLVLDEAHHGTADSYRRVIDYYATNPDLKILGVTATPDRADEAALGQIFDDVSYEYDIIDGVMDGFLVPISQISVFVDKLDLSKIRTTAGDLNGADLARVMEAEETLHEMASPTLELAKGRKTLVFAASVAHAERLAEIFNRHESDIARCVTGTTDKDARREMFKDYANNKFQILVNVGVATEGFDDPGIEVVVMGRPTKSRSLYAQMAGRGTRPFPGCIDGLDDPQTRREAIAISPKPDLVIIDFVGNAGRHKLVTAADVLGGKYDDAVVERAARDAARESADTGKPVDILSELERAELKILKEARDAEEAAKRSVVKIRAKYSTAKVNPFDVYDLMPRRVAPWHKDRAATEAQVGVLVRAGIDPAGLNFTHASQLIGTLVERREKNLATFKQIRLLQRFGYEVEGVTFNEASGIIDKLAKNNWKRV